MCLPLFLINNFEPFVIPWNKFLINFFGILLHIQGVQKNRNFLKNLLFILSININLMNVIIIILLILSTINTIIKYQEILFSI